MPPPVRRPRLGSHSQSSPNLPTLNTNQSLRTVPAPFPSPLAKQQNTSTRETFPELNSYSAYTQDGGEHTSKQDVEGAQIGRNGAHFGPRDSDSNDSESEEEEDDDDEDDPTPEARSSPRHSYLGAKTAASVPVSSTTSPLSPTTSASLAPHSAGGASSGTSSKAPRPAPIRAQSLFNRGALRSQSSSNLAGAFHHQPNPAAFAPPFYNRPPTPLPPSPSLTSLLRPSFSTASTAPPPPPPAAPRASSTHSATPSIAAPTPTDSSSDTDATAARARLAPGTGIGTGASTPAAGASTTSLGGLSRAALAAPSSDTVARAAPAVPTYEYYGFVLHLGSSAFFGAYVLWASLPTPLLAALGVTYYPSRWWSLAVPCWIVVALGWVYVALASYNTTVLTERAAGLGCLVDDAGQVAVVDAHGRIVRRERRRVLRGPARDADGGEARGRRRRERERQGQAQQVSAGSGGGGGGGVGGGAGGSAGGGADRADKAAAVPARELDWRALWNEGTDAVLDVPIGGVCEVLYGDGRERSDGSDAEDLGRDGLDAMADGIDVDTG